MIQIYKPYLPKHCLQFAHHALDTGWISSEGEYKVKAVEEFKRITGAKNVLLVSNGTCAMHLVALALKYKYPYIRTLLVPNSVYVAAWNAFEYEFNSWDIKVQRVDENTWNFDLDTDDIDNMTAILCVHNLGNIINVPVLQSKIKRKYPGVVFIEDACEAFGGYYDGKFAGTDSFCSAFSFFGNKNITSGEGGAVIVNDDDTFKYITKIHGQGQTSTKYVHDVLGYNYRMTNVQAAILYGQLKYYDEIKERKDYIFDRYRKELSSVDTVRLQVQESGTIHSNWLMGVRVIGSNFQRALDFFHGCGVDIRPFFYPISSHKHLIRHSPSDEKTARMLNRETFMIPGYPELSESEVSRIVETIKQFSKKI